MKMPSGDTVIVFDCGATNIRVIAINGKGSILAAESLPNFTQPDPNYPAYRIWDIKEIWDKMCLASQRVMSQINKNLIIGVTVTTFGVDGTLFDKTGKMLYPVISWQCERTKPVLSEIGKYIAPTELYMITGVFPFHFNTISKLIWLKENKPDIIEKSSSFLFMPSIFSLLLTGNMVNDKTMAGTSMCTDLTTGSFSENIFEKIGFPITKISPAVEAGTITGKINSLAASETGIPESIPVIATGHDTQFALFGSGAEKNEAVLSSGTWEILMARTERFLTGKEQFEMGITTEFDSRPGLYNIGKQWLASGNIEWVRNSFYSDVTKDVYEVMISGAEKVPSGSNGIKFVPEINEKIGGTFPGRNLKTSRDEIFRAVLETLSERLREGKTALEKAGGFTSESILCVGGGSKNRLWNQLRANSIGIPLRIIDHKETTVLGASLFVQAACGNATTPEEARSQIKYKTEVIEPE
jgi:L-fuculokinase